MNAFVPVELEHAATLLTGQMALPAGDGPFPTVLVMHNALGIGDHVRGVTQRLAALGYVAVASDMYGSGAGARPVVSYHGILASAQPMQPGGFAGEVHAYCGAADPYAPLAQIAGLRAEMADAGVKHTITTFGEAAHGFTDPAADAMGREGIAYNAMADRLSWAGTVALLKAVLMR